MGTDDPHSQDAKSDVDLRFREYSGVRGSSCIHSFSEEESEL